MCKTPILISYPILIKEKNTTFKKHVFWKMRTKMRRNISNNFECGKCYVWRPTLPLQTKRKHLKSQSENMSGTKK